MSEPVAQESPLAAALATNSGPGASAREASVLVESAFAGYLNLRGDPGDRTFLNAASDVLGFGLPEEPNTVAAAAQPTQAGVTACWLGPDEWMVITPPDRQTGLMTALIQATADRHVAVTDLTGGYTTIQLSGPRVRDLLAKGSTLDLHPRSFGAGQCAQTNVGKTGVLLIPAVNDVDVQSFQLVVRRSFADYLFHWIQHSSTEYGLRIEAGSAGD